ncbi:MAG TPA: hypothetical protein VL486_00320 [Verrucomicrobiae bacterium]|nr:hypothetical protein [Verrucomicrobiae bacterium]
MNLRNWLCGLILILLPVPVMSAINRTEKFRNDKVLVVEQTLPPGGVMNLPVDRPVVMVYLNDEPIVATPTGGNHRMETVKRGQAVFEPPQSGAVRNDGKTDLRIVSVEFLGSGGSVTWGTAGLAPDYKLLFENRYGRVYDIKMAAGKSEPLHSHHDRVVVCLSGAELEHEMPDGRRETSTLKTGEIVWRRGGTHVGHNVGKTDLWVIAIEPK